MSGAVALKDQPVIQKEELMNYLKTFAGTAQLTVGETSQFIAIAQAFNLNPFKREIYAVAYTTQQGRKLSIITGYEVYLKRAERLGTLDGWEVAIDGEGDKMKAILTVYRKDWSHPFKHEVYFEEVAKRDKTTKKLQSMWETMPKFMLKKVAVAQGFRLAFPDEFGGMPYTADELPDNMTAGFANMADASKETSKDAEYIPPAHPSGPKNETPPQQPRQVEPAQAGSIAEGELIPSDYWKLDTAGKKAMLGEGFKAEKINGAWICVRK